MLELGIDELTVVLHLHDDTKQEMDDVLEWEGYAGNLIDAFLQKSEFENVLGEQQNETRPPAGYTYAYTYGDHGFYLAVAYHQYMVNMGVIVKFSAQALDYYLTNSGLTVYEFVQRIQPTPEEKSLYFVRISRIDLTADYINEGINITETYQNLIEKKIGVFRERERKNTNEKYFRRIDMLYQGFIKGEEVPTIYIGANRGKSRLRIYDKKREQEERRGTKLDKAKQCKDWTRFEGSFLHHDAHQIGSALLDIHNDDELANLIASTLIQKFRLMYTDNGEADCDTEYSQMLIDSIQNNSFQLRSLSSRNYDLAKSISYLFVGSGAITTLYKIKQIWGEEVFIDFMRFIVDCLQGYLPNDDCRYWLRKNANDYRKAFPDFNEFLRGFLPEKLWCWDGELEND